MPSGCDATHSRRPGGLGRLLACRSGAAGIEFALIAPAFLILTMGIIEMGRYTWYQSTMQQAADTAGRYAMAHIDASEADLKTAAGNALYGLDANDFVISATPETVGSQNYVTVTITRDFTLMVPYVTDFGISTITSRSRVPLVN